MISEPENIFELENVTYRYPNARQDVFRNLSLSIPAGKTTVVVGRNGIGKSTLLYLLGLLWEGKLGAENKTRAEDQVGRDSGGNDKPRGGKILYHGPGADTKTRSEGYGALNADKRAELRSRHFGFVLQSSYMLPTLTCVENIAMPLLLQGESYIRCGRRARALVWQADQANPIKDLWTHRNHLPRRLSGGQRTRMSFLRAVIHDPSVLFADEPLSHLDAANSAAVVELIRLWKAGTLRKKPSESNQRTLILVTHDLEETYDLADYFLVFAQDGNLADGGVVPRQQVDAEGGLNRIRQLLQQGAAPPPSPQDVPP